MSAPIDLDSSVAGKVAVVTGSGAGIGMAIARTFAAKGMTVAVVARSVEAADRVATGLGSDAGAFACDVADADSVEGMAAQVFGRYGRVDVLVNSAGVSKLGRAEELAEADWDLVVDVNLKGTFLTCQAVGRRMLEQGHGKIINLASQGAHVALEQHVAYCASKFGLLGLTKTLALEWAGRGVTVNSISPTVVLTEMGRMAWDNPAGEVMKARIPVGRFAVPEDVAAAAVFLASAGSDMINGADLLLDGGFTVH